MYEKNVWRRHTVNVRIKGVVDEGKKLKKGRPSARSVKQTQAGRCRSAWGEEGILTAVKQDF